LGVNLTVLFDKSVRYVKKVKTTVSDLVRCIAFYQARSKVLSFGEVKYTFKGERFLFLLCLKAICLWTKQLWGRKIFGGMTPELATGLLCTVYFIQNGFG